MATYPTRLPSSATLCKPQIKNVPLLHFEIGGTTFGTTAFCMGQLLALAGEEPSRAGGRIYYTGGKERSFVLFRLSFRYSYHCTSDSFPAICLRIPPSRN